MAGLPVSPVNAWNYTSRHNTHDSGPKRIAISISYRTFIDYLLPVCPGASQTTFSRFLSSRQIEGLRKRGLSPIPRVPYSPDSGERLQVLPGALRERDVRVGRHLAVSPGAVPRFLARLADAYGGLGKAEGIISAAAAHHRLLWIHPFLDGNGRVARLLSHALLLDALDTGGVWSIARGLARNVHAYKTHLAACDLPRRNDLDGRGHLSEEALADFTRFFLETCLDQVRFMETLVQPERLRERILLWTEDAARLGELPPKAGRVLEAILYRGELPRGDVPDLLGTSERSARRVVAALVEQGVVQSASTRAPLRIAFPARLAARWMPGLFPEAP